MEFDFDEPHLSRIQSYVRAQMLEKVVRETVLTQDLAECEILDAMLDSVLSKINEDEEYLILGGLRVIYFLISAFEQHPHDQDLAKDVYALLAPKCLPVMLEAFTKEEVGPHSRSNILIVFFLMVRGIAWADGIDNELVQACLDDTFSNWMALFLQILQSSTNRNFVVKKYALRCLTVIFRDLLNYSRSSLNMILKPAWKLLNQSLSIYTEVVAFGARQTDSDEEDDSDHLTEQWDCEDED